MKTMKTRNMRCNSTAFSHLSSDI